MIMILFLFVWTAEIRVYASDSSKQDEFETDMPNENEKEIKLYAQAATLMDAVSGRILFEKNGEEEKPNASTTKILTCITVLENVQDLKQLVEISAYAARQPKVHLGMYAGEHYQMEDLLYSMMLESHNDSAVALAETVGRKMLGQKGQDAESEEAVLCFVDAMNKKALEIGCEHTCFVTPNGLDAVRTITNSKTGEIIEQKHVTSSNDLARIMAYCIYQSPCRDKFLQITKTPSYQFYEAAKKRHFECNNRNALLSMREDAVSGKTGFTAAAGYCYVGAVSSEGRLYTVALLGDGWPGNKNYKWKDSKVLFDYGEENYEVIDLAEYYARIKEVIQVPVDNGIGERLFETPLCSASVDTEKVVELPKTMLMKITEKMRVEVCCEERISAPVSRGKKLGTITVYRGDEVWLELPILARNDIGQIDQKWYISQVIKTYFSL